MDSSTQFAQATLNLLRHVAMSAPVPVIVALKEQLELRYQQCLEPLHPGVDFLVKATLEGDFESVLPMVEGLLQSGVTPSVAALEQSLSDFSQTQKEPRVPHNPAAHPRSPMKGAAKGYRDYFASQ